MFACERVGFEAGTAGALLGVFDGTDRRDIHLYATSSREEQLLVSLHEHLHHELQWSTAWGVLAAMSGLLAEAGIETERLTQVARTANGAARQVHEVFATTVSVGVIGVQTGRGLLAGNKTYSQYLSQGLTLGGASESAPWQLRESAIQMYLRLLLQPAELANVAERGFSAVRLRDLQSVIRPDVRFAATAELAPRWWDNVYRELLEAYPDRGGDRGDRWSRSAPTDPAEIEALKQWEESILIPRLAREATAQLRNLGIPVLDHNAYLEVIDALRKSFLEHAPDDWQVEVYREPHQMVDEPLGVERESSMLWPSPAALKAIAPEDLDERVADLRHGTDQQTGLALYLLPATYSRQFAGAPEVAPGTAPLLALAGRVRVMGDGESRSLPLAFIRPEVTPRQLMEDFPEDCLFLTTLRVTRERAVREEVLSSDEAYVLIDLPLRRQVASWIKSGWTLRFRVLALGPDVPVNLVVFRLDELERIWFLSYRSDAGFGELAQIMNEWPEHLHGDLDLDASHIAQIGTLTSWLLSAWWRLEEIEEWTTSTQDSAKDDRG